MTKLSEDLIAGLPKKKYYIIDDNNEAMDDKYIKFKSNCEGYNQCLEEVTKYLEGVELDEDEVARIIDKTWQDACERHEATIMDTKDYAKAIRINATVKKCDYPDCHGLYHKIDDDNGERCPKNKEC